MKILMLGWELPPHNSGGLGVACVQMSKALAVQGASIDFIVPYTGDHSDIDFMNVHAALDQAPEYSLTSSGAYHVPAETNSLRATQDSYIRYVEQHIGDNENYDAIHAHDWLTLEAGIKAKQMTDLPLVAHVHATEYDRAGGERGNPLVHEIEQTGLLLADRIIAVSHETKKTLISRYGIPAGNIEVMHNAISASTLIQHEYDERTYPHLEALKRQGYTVVVAVTRFTVQKGLTHLMIAAARASERYHKLVFLFAGDGEQRDELLRLSAELGIADKVFFTGFVRGKQWRDAYKVANIFVMSSVSEPFGITALEAAHFGNAVILTKQSGVGEVLRSVYKYDFWDTDALANRLITLADSNALRATMKENLSSEYRALSWDDVAKKCMRLYRSFPKKAAYV